MRPFLLKIAVGTTVAALIAVAGFWGWKKFILDPELAWGYQVIPSGTTFSTFMSKVGIATSSAFLIYEGARPVYDFSEIIANRVMAFGYDKAGILQEIRYDINGDEQLIINRATTTAEFWSASRIKIEYETRIAEERGIIEESLYKTVISRGIDQRLALALAEMFAWQIDFAGEIQKGDSFRVIYEQKYRDGEYDHVGKILAAEFINAGENFKGFHFSGNETREGYYDENGNSLQKVFLKAPLQYRYISSGFTYRRINPVTGNSVSPHRGIDYAAAHGTPAVTVGDGTVIQAGWNGPYGLSVKVRHNDTYTTVYGHFSSLAKGIRVGAKVRQGQIVGYVGSTGLSTGPHLHYEMHKFGAFINPFTEKVPSIEPVSEADIQDFQKIMSELSAELEKIQYAG
mgnify:CR=1 FL=1